MADIAASVLAKLRNKDKSFWYQLPAMFAAFCAGRIFEKVIKIWV